MSIQREGDWPQMDEEDMAARVSAWAFSSFGWTLDSWYDGQVAGGDHGARRPRNGVR